MPLPSQYMLSSPALMTAHGASTSRAQKPGTDTRATRPKNRTAAPTARALIALLKPLPPAFRKTMTLDNGTEFLHHAKLHRINLKTYFCDPHSPWQKGSIENAIGRLRRFLPRKTDLAILNDTDFNACIRTYNNTPRECLGYKTPAEVFCQQLLHFKCESTLRLSPE